MLPIIDLHCHPSLKIYLFNKDIAKRHFPLPDIIPTGMHVDLPGMYSSGVKVVCCSHYIPESGFGHLRKSKWLFKILGYIAPRLISRFESDGENDGAFYRSLQSFELLNNQIGRYENRFNVIIARNLAEFEHAFKEGKTIFVHCLEGSHHLGKNFTAPEDYITRLNIFKQKGLCILTLSHFFQNAISDSAGGIPPLVANLIGYTKPASQSDGLSRIGTQIVEWCQDNGVILDLVHSTIETRKQVYNLLTERKSKGKKVNPIIFSHSGIREMADPNMQNRHDLLILPNIEEVREIRRHGGIVGLILMNYWITGIEEDNLFEIDRGIENILDTIDFIATILGDFDTIGIGSDLDGFTQTPDDIYHVRLFDRLRSAIIRKFGIEAAMKICYQNALRVIRNGWS